MMFRLRKIFFFLGLAALPIIVLIILEGFARLVSPGPNLDLVIPDPERPGYVRLNPDVSLRYFPRSSMTGFGQDRAFPLKKPPHTFRIITLGGSTTAGFPYFYAGSFPQIMEFALNAGSPDVFVEVINGGMTAVNSVTVLDLIPDCLKLNPDLIVIYSGHNEFYGALGTATALGFPWFYGSRWLTTLMLKLHRLRLYQLILNTVSTWRESSSGTLMSQVYTTHLISRQSRIFARTIKRFSDNLKAILALTFAEKVPVLLATVPSNLESQPPLQDLAPLLKSSPAFRKAEQSLADSLWTTALTDLKLLMRNNPDEPTLHFLAGQCYLNLGDTATAVTELVQARDLDGIRFRAPTDINQVIRSMAGHDGLEIADLDSLFFGHPAARLPGGILFLEHVHPTLTGNGMIAAFLAQKISPYIPGAGAPPPESVPNALALVTELDRTAARLQVQILTDNPPFTRSSGQTLKDIQPAGTMETIAVKMLAGKLSYREGHLRMADFFQSEGQNEKAVRECQALVNQYPDDVSLRKALAVTSLRTSNHKRTYAILKTLVKTQEEDPFVLKWAGIFALDAGDAKAAARWLERARRLKDDDQIRYNLTGAYLRLGRMGKALPELDTLLKRNPDYPRAQQLKHRLTADKPALPRK
ncbi:MAG: tetratricopeptide repeat protein [Fidelibacterota bacterium]